jgi:hypothetical protein
MSSAGLHDVNGGYTSVFEVICCDCGDNPCPDYCEVSARLQRLRGPYTLRRASQRMSAHGRGLPDGEGQVVLGQVLLG